uniref:DUF4265 domain-containing protein n=1 Tax=Cellvibrio fontiphilus TaxID=1815559 RepID=UPI002B4BB610|nr:DUF4265 domain-containing protein [Cellvibrio fontiphilus]
MEKVKFALDIEDDWPPVSSESVWCERVGENYKVLNAPFFIHRLAYGDVFSAVPDSVNQHVFEFEVIEQSGHSLVWLMNAAQIEISEKLESISELGCNYEGFPLFNLVAIDVPPNVNFHALDVIIESLETNGIAVAFPVWRHVELH